MSIKARLKKIEGQLPDIKEAAKENKPGKDDLLFMENKEYQEHCIEWLMSLYIGDEERAAAAEEKANSILESLEPVMKPSQFNPDVYKDLLAEKIVDWMEENNLEDLDDERWEWLMNGAENEA